jgi:23S rRNA (cytosine1962-C5)-methyltransferase
MPGSIEIWKDDWDQFELLDSGNYRRLERYGDLVIVRSEPRAWWQPELPKSDWDKAQALFEKEESADWTFKGKVSQFFTLPFDSVKARIKMTKMSKHVGVFPEQSQQWRWISKRVKDAGREVSVLNLFAYTGMSTLAAASAGAKVTHVDGSKVALTWANENAELSGLKDKPIRWILDDALKFVKREVRRGHKYDAIIMDPPAFGRGPKGEVWKVEESINELLNACQELLSDDAIFFFVTMYSIEASSLSLRNLLSDSVSGRGGKLTNGELTLQPKNGGKPLPLSIFAAWEK